MSNISPELTAELNEAVQTIAIAMLGTEAIKVYNMSDSERYIAVALSLESVAMKLRQTAAELPRPS